MESKLNIKICSLLRRSIVYIAPLRGNYSESLSNCIHCTWARLTSLTSPHLTNNFYDITSSCYLSILYTDHHSPYWNGDPLFAVQCPRMLELFKRARQRQHLFR